MELAPIVLFVYNRPWHTKQCLEALSANELAKDSILYIYADGSKKNAGKEELDRINQVQQIIQLINSFKEVRIINREKNFGLVKSIIAGVTEVINEHDKVIVLEDDLVVSKGFLKFMNQALHLYKEEKNVYSITGYMFDLNDESKKAVLLPYISTWSWGTWKDRWSTFDIDTFENIVLSDSKLLSNRFNLGDYDYVKMLESTGTNSWGIKWYLHIFKRNGLSLFPTRSLVSNNGFDGTGVNCDASSSGKQKIANNIEVKLESEIDLLFFKKYMSYFHKDKTYNRLENFISFFKS